jgi:lipid-A-disaccharide synthase
LVNLVAEKEVVPELLQHKATPENIYKEILPLLLNKDAAEAMRDNLAETCKQLGEPGASKRVAKLVREIIAAGEPHD